MITATGDFHIHPHFHHFSHSKGTSVKFTASGNYDVFSQQEGRVKMGPKPPTQPVSGLLWKKKKIDSIFHRMTHEPINIQWTVEKNILIVTFSFIAVCGKTVHCIASLLLNHKLECVMENE